MKKAERVVIVCLICNSERELLKSDYDRGVRVGKIPKFCSFACRQKYCSQRAWSSRQDYKSNFLGKIDKTPGLGPWGDCQEWLGSTNQDGYGKMRIGKKLISVHRFSFELYKEKIPKNKEVGHLCNNKLCVNPEHLEICTNEENNDYKIKCGRQAKGEKNGRAKLTEEQIKEIRKFYDEYKPNQSILAKKYSVDQTMISCIVLRKNWKGIEYEGSEWE